MVQILVTRPCYFLSSTGPSKKRKWRMLGLGIGFWRLIIRLRYVQADILELYCLTSPCQAQPLLALINLELALSNFAEVEAIFASTLKGSAGITTAADVSIWAAYLHYIRRQNPLTEGSANAADVRSTITEAYEFALRECGFDRESGDIWDEYIKFVASGPVCRF